MGKQPTLEAKDLHQALIDEGVPAELEKWDGHKHIDIAIVESRINIEVDGEHHNHDSRQALKDLKRTYHSFKKGYFTIRIPNSLIREEFHETVDWILDIIEEQNNKLNSQQ